MSQFESIDKVLKKGRLELQEVKKKFQKPEDPWDDDSTVRTNTNRNPNETIFGDNKNKKKKFNNNTNNNVPPKNETPLTKHQKARQKVLQKRTCLLYTSPSPRDATLSRMPSSA